MATRETEKNMILVECLALPLTISAATTTGEDFVFRRVGQMFSIEKTAFDGSSALYDTLKTEFDLGNIRIYVDGEIITSMTTLRESGYVSVRGMSYAQPHTEIIGDINHIETHEWFDTSGNKRRKTGSLPTSDTDGYPIDGYHSNNEVPVGTGCVYGTTELSDAMNDIVGNLATNPFTIKVLDGVFVVDNPVTLKDYVSIVGMGPDRTRLQAGNPLFPLFVDTAMLADAQISGVSIELGTYGIDQTLGTSKLILDNVKFVDQSVTSILQGNPGSTLIGRDIEVDSGVPATSGIASTAGTMELNNVKVISTAGALAIGIDAAGGTVRLGNAEIMTRGAGTLVDGISVDQSSVELASKCFISDATNSGIIVSNQLDSQVTGAGPSISNCTTNDIEFIGGDASVATFMVNAGSWDDDKVSGMPVGFRSVNNNMNYGRQAHSVVNAMSIGRPGLTRHGHTGQGAPDTRGIKVFRNTNGEAGAWTDITANMINFSGGPDVPIFNGLLANLCWYVGMDRKFTGFDIDIVTALVPAPGSIIWEYWNGAAWTEFKVMAENGASPYTRLANATFEDVIAETTRFDRYIASAAAAWATKALNGSTKYWIRARIVAPITTDAEAQWIMIHADSIRNVGDGAIEVLGNSRRLRKTFPNSKHMPGAGAPNSVTVNAGVGINFDVVAEHPAAADTFVVFEHIVESWMDTSSGLWCCIDWKGDIAAVGNTARWSVTLCIVKPGDVEDNASAVSTVIVDSTDAAVNVIVRAVLPRLEIDTAVPGDKLVLKVMRAGTADTYLGNAIRRSFFFDTYEMATSEYLQP